MADLGSLGSITGVAENLNPNNLITILNHPVFGKIFFYVKVFLWFAGFAGLAILFYKTWLQYNIKVGLKVRIGGTASEHISTRAKLVVDEQNKRKLVLWKRYGKKVLTCPVPEAKYKMKIGRSDYYELWVDDNFQLHPIHLEETDANNIPQLKIKPQEREAWRSYELKRVFETFMKKSDIEKYLPSAVMIIACVTSFLIFFFAFKELGGAMGSLAVEFRQVAASCTALR